MTAGSHHETVGGSDGQGNNPVQAIFSRALLEALPHKVFYKDLDSVYICCNSLYAADLKITPAEITGTTDFDYYPTDLAEKYRSDDKQVMKTGASMFVEEEYLLEGQPRWVATVKGPARDEKGQVVGVVGIFWDITDKKQAEESLQESEERFRSAFEQAAVGMSFVEPDGKWLMVNQKLCDIVGYAKAELLGLTFQDITHPDDLEADLELVRQVVNDEIQTYSMDKRYLRKDRSIVWIKLTVSLVRWPSGEAKYFISIIEDISRRKVAEDILQQTLSAMEDKVKERTAELHKNQLALVNVLEDVTIGKKELEAANEKLKELDRLKSMFIASMSHELRTPLNSIIGFSSIMHDEWIGAVNAEQKLNLASILHNGEHLLALINDVIDISKIEADKIDIRITTFELREVINEAVEGFRQTIKNKGLALRLEVYDATMTTDRRRLLQVILNLINNAVKFTNAGVITVTARQDQDDFVTISVEDSGIGIQADAMDKLFMAFSRVHAKGNVEYPGTGLGLYLSMKLTREVLRGELKAASTYGHGSTFTISLPMRIQE